MTASSVLLDTHVLLWVIARSRRQEEVSSLRKGHAWALSPVSLLEIKFLSEIGRIEADFPGLLSQLRQDDRFRIDDIGLEDLCNAACDLSWTRDPFDRFLVAHSMIRSLPLGTVDETIRKNHSMTV